MEAGTELASQRSGINALVIRDGQLWWTETDGPRLMAFSSDMEEPVERFGPPDIRAPLVLRVGDVDESGTVALSLGLDSWPYSGLMCQFNSTNDRLSCGTHGPPKAVRPIFHEGSLIWQTQFGIGRAPQGMTYGFIGDPVSPGGFHVDGNDLWLTDKRGGKVLRTPLNEAP